MGRFCCSFHTCHSIENAAGVVSPIFVNMCTYLLQIGCNTGKLQVQAPSEKGNLKSEVTVLLYNVPHNCMLNHEHDLYMDTECSTSLQSVAASVLCCRPWSQRRRRRRKPWRTWPLPPASTKPGKLTGGWVSDVHAFLLCRRVMGLSLHCSNDTLMNPWFWQLPADMFILMTWSVSGLRGSCELLIWGTVSWHVHSDDLVYFRFGRFLWIVILGHCQLTCSFWWLGLFQVWEVPVNCYFGALSADMFLMMTWSGSGLGGSCELFIWTVLADVLIMLAWIVSGLRSSCGSSAQRITWW